VIEFVVLPFRHKELQDILAIFAGNESHKPSYIFLIWWMRLISAYSMKLEYYIHPYCCLIEASIMPKKRYKKIPPYFSIINEIGG